MTLSATKPSSSIVYVNGESFELKKHIGSGGFANVFQAKSLQTHRTVALKQIDSKVRGAHSSFMAEKLYQGALKHPNIIKLIHAQLSDLTLVSELAKFDLHWVLFERKRSLTTRTKRLIPPQLIDALAYMHSQEIVHQDLKYENIVFINATTVKIIDFGLAATIKLDENGEEIAAKNRAGTSRYWSPQKLAGTPILATKEDVFSLAQMLLAIEVGNPWDKPDKRMRAYRNWVKNPMADERFATLATQQEEYYLLLRWMLNHDQEGRCSALEAKESRYMKTACFQKRGRKRPRKIALGVL